MAVFLSVPLDKKALADDPVTLTVFDPTGSLEINQFHAPRLDNLNGNTFCELATLAWRDTETFPIVRQLLQRQFSAVKII